MVSNFHLPPVGFGPGSQPEEGETLEYMQMPDGMRTYSAHTPDVGDPGAVMPTLTLLAEIADAAGVAARGRGAAFDLTGLDAANRRLLDEIMGQGEVSMKIRGQPSLSVQESVFAGVWRVVGEGVDRIEVGPVPAAATAAPCAPRRAALGAAHPRGTGVVNAPAIHSELADKAANSAETEPHVVNLTLLPHTEEDLLWLDAALGEGAVTILSRGYGNCRITATALAPVWRVQFFNSMDTLILDTFEVTPIPEVALAASEDLADSADRLREVLEAIR